MAPEGRCGAAESNIDVAGSSSITESAEDVSSGGITEMIMRAH